MYIKDGDEPSLLSLSIDDDRSDSLKNRADTTYLKGNYRRAYKRKDSIRIERSNLSYKQVGKQIIASKKRRDRDTLLTSFHRTEFPKRDKFRHDTLIDLNLADTTLLMRVPGIGSSRSKRIISYRDKLGGYISVSQLNEIEGLPDTLHRWFMVSGTPLRCLAVNRDGVEKLRRHPYMNFYRARRIVEYRKEYGTLSSISQLALFEEFPDSVLNKIEGYLCFE